MLFQCGVPASPLDAFVEMIWLYKSDPKPHGLERLLPTGTPGFIVNLKENEVRRYEPGGVCVTALPHACTRRGRDGRHRSQPEAIHRALQDALVGVSPTAYEPPAPSSRTTSLFYKTESAPA